MGRNDTKDGCPIGQIKNELGLCVPVPGSFAEEIFDIETVSKPPKEEPKTKVEPTPNKTEILETELEEPLDVDIKEREKFVSKAMRLGLSEKEARRQYRREALAPKETGRLEKEEQLRRRKENIQALIEELKEKKFPIPTSIAPITGLFGEQTITESFAEPFIRLDKNIKERIAGDTDEEMVELGFGAGLLKVAGGGVVGGAIASLFVRPALTLLEFDRQAATLTETIPDYRETLGKVVGNARIGAYSSNPDLNIMRARARLDAIEEKVAEIESNIRESANNSPSIVASGQNEKVLSKLEKFKEELILARQSIFLIEQTGKLDLSQEEVIDLLREISENE